MVSYYRYIITDIPISSIHNIDITDVRYRIIDPQYRYYRCMISHCYHRFVISVSLSVLLMRSTDIIDA
ncbi:Ribosome-recycling factor [Dirofilaria immitis]